MEKKSAKIFNGRMKGVIRMLHKRGFTYKELAKRFYCSKSTIKRYCTVY